MNQVLFNKDDHMTDAIISQIEENINIEEL